ncbi:hypothetical protein [Mesorhizobium sp. BR115XR7A]|uniref:hypothetical protein n=1 Tax=Mesorhizobium sp. BR115XR7A TaxID=2876645 RepID=UPI001CCAB384|nr:hypothetical protein [Mesorhizobium sp. BR115XR7A]MBZ9933465.1 hypothetical protein [Mesorhizobium sp. BR1-1-5]
MSKILPTEADRHRAALQLPRASAEYLVAEKTSRDASAKLRALVGRREALTIESGIENPAKTKIPTHALNTALDGLTVEIADAQNAERTARAEFDRLRAIYRQEAAAALQADIESFGSAITRRLDEILELLDVGSELASQAREAGVNLPSSITDAPVGRRFAQTMTDTLNECFQREELGDER